MKITLQEMHLLERAFRCKDKIQAKEAMESTSGLDPAQANNEKNLSLACLDLYESLTKLVNTKKMMKAY